MLAFVRLGSWLIQLPLLALLVGAWGALTFVNYESKRLNLNPSTLHSLILFPILVGIVGARLGYALSFPGLYTSKPLSLLAFTPSTLSPSVGFVFGLVTFVIVFQQKQLPLRPTLDALAPGLALFMVFVAVSHILSGDAYGAPTRVPWAVHLWNEYRHPTQFYEALIAVGIFRVVLRRFPKPEDMGVNFLLFMVLTAGSRVFLEAFRGDSVILPGGLREAQVIALILMAASFYWMSRWMNPTQAA